MHLAWLSDTHFNFLDRDSLTRFVVTLARTDCDAFLITGDIAEAPTLTAHLTILDRSLERPVYFVLGNHDFYRSSIAAVRHQVTKLTETANHLQYLTISDGIPLTSSTVLIGHDGWADGRFGDFHHSLVMMSDFELIEDFGGGEEDEGAFSVVMKADLLRIMWRLADEALAHLERVVPAALERARHVIVATHVPPFREACFHGGRISTDDFLPFFASRIVGDYLREVMEQHPDKRMTVYCGHCHGLGRVQILDNLVVETAGAEYGIPAIQRIIPVD